MKLLTVTGHWRRLTDNHDHGELEMGLVFETPGRWLRLAAFYGGAPGSHMAGKHFTVWRTKLGTFDGWNLRTGWWPRPCVTLLVHTHPVRKDWPPVAWPSQEKERFP
jgi:hypothetical protein